MDDPMHGPIEVAHEILHGLSVDSAVKRWLGLQPATPEEFEFLSGLFFDGSDWTDGWAKVPTTLRLDLLVHAADLLLAHADDCGRTGTGGDFSYLGDCTADHLVGDDPAMIEELHQRRRTSPGVRQLFLVVHDDLTSIGYGEGSWWAQASPRPQR